MDMSKERPSYHPNVSGYDRLNRLTKETYLSRRSLYFVRRSCFHTLIPTERTEKEAKNYKIILEEE